MVTIQLQWGRDEGKKGQCEEQGRAIGSERWSVWKLGGKRVFLILSYLLPMLLY